MMKRIFRYGYSTVCVIVGLVVGFFVFHYYAGAEQIDINEKTDRSKYEYKYELPIAISGDEYSLELLHKADIEGCSISIVDQLIYFDGAAGSYMTDIVISGREFIYPIVAGHYPTDSELASGEPCAVLGRRMKQYTFRMDGEDYIRVCGDNYRVTGYISADDSAIFDFRTILYYECMGDGVSKDLAYFHDLPGWTFLIQSNTVDRAVMRERVRNVVEEGSYDIIDLGQYNHFTATRNVDREYKNMAVIIYAFSIFIVILVVEYHLICRKREFAIKKAYGYSTSSLLLGVLIELVAYVLVSIVIAELLMLLFNFVEKEAVIFTVRGFKGRLRVMIRYFAFTLPILMLRPVVKLSRDNPIKLLVSKDY